MTEKPVTREELIAFLDENRPSTREEVHEAILAAWDVATSGGVSEEAFRRFREVT